LIASLSAIACLLAAAAVLAVSVFPLTATTRPAQTSPQTATAPLASSPALKPVIDANIIWLDTVRKGSMSIMVRGLGTLALLNGQNAAKVDLPESQVGDVRAGQSAEVHTHKGIVKGHVIRVSSEVLRGTRRVFIALDSALPAGLDAHAQVEGVITIARLDNVLYVGRPVQDKADSIFKVVDNGKAAERVEVHFGRVGVSTIQVLSGLNLGDTVILSAMSPYDKFDRVQIKQ
jgi:hypothetical protein